MSKTFQVVKRVQQSRWLEGMKAPRAAHSPRDTAVARWKIAFLSLRTTHLYRSAFVVVKARFSRSVRYSFSGLNHEANACHVREDGERVSRFPNNCRAWQPRSNQISAPIGVAILNIFFFSFSPKMCWCWVIDVRSRKTATCSRSAGRHPRILAGLRLTSTCIR